MFMATAPPLDDPTTTAGRYLSNSAWAILTASSKSSSGSFGLITSCPCCAIFAERSTIELRIRARSDPERLFLADTLISGIWAAWAYDPAGNVREAIIQRQLAEAGIQLQEIGQPSYPEPTLADARPEGQIYQATVPLVCTLQMSWDTGTTTYGAITVGPTVISDPTAYGFSVVDAVITP